MNDQSYMTRVRSMERKLYRIAHAILFSDADCADAIQEAVFKGWMKKGSLHEEKYFETWMVRILINECRNLLRSGKNIHLPLNEALASAAQPELNEDIHLRMAIRNLPEKYRMPLLLHHLEGYSLAEIARMLDIPQGMVKSRLHQGRSALRKILNAGGESL